MAAEDRVRQLMIEIGPLVDDIEVVEQEGPTHWDIGFTDGDALSLDYEADARKLTLMADLGTPTDAGEDPAARFALYELMLAYNFLSADTGGLRLAIDSPGGAAVLMVDLFTLDLDTATFADVLASLRDVAQEWRAIVAGEARPGADAGQDSSDPVIRV